MQLSTVYRKMDVRIDRSPFASVTPLRD